MADELEAPRDPAELYAGRHNEILEVRPEMQGDIYAEVEIPGVDGGPGLAAILTHPCSMRSDGVVLVERLLLARVEPGHEVALSGWRGFFKLMPLPELVPGETGHAVMFDLCGRVSSQELTSERRIACLGRLGIALLQQRFIHHLTRLVVPTRDLYEASAHVLEEAELLEDWLAAAASSDSGIADASHAFHQYIRGEALGDITLQQALMEPASRAYVRRAVGEERKRLFGSSLTDDRSADRL